MSSSELKLNLHKLIDGITDTSVLQALYTSLSNSNATGSDWYDELSEEAKVSIDRGLKDLEQGNFVSFEDVESELDGLLNR